MIGKSIIAQEALILIKEEVLRFLRGEDVRVFLFGSRARGDAHAASDFDIGIIAGEAFDRKKLALLRERIEGLNIPYKVEIVDFSGVSEEFKKATIKEAEVWRG